MVFDDVLLRAVGADVLVDVEGGGVHGAEGGEGIEGERDVGAAELVEAEERGSAELGDVGEDGNVGALGEGAVLGKLGDGFGEDHVGARFYTGCSAIKGGVEAFGGKGVGAGHDDEVGVGAGVDGGLDAVGHLFGGDDLFVGAVAAALGLDLVFDVAAGGSGLDERADGAGEVEGSAEAGVDVYEEGQGADVGDAANVGEDVVDGGDAEVGDAEGACGDASAGEVEGAIADALGHEGVVGVDGANDLERVLGCDGRAKFRSGCDGWRGVAHAVRYLAEVRVTTFLEAKQSRPSHSDFHRLTAQG